VKVPYPMQAAVDSHTRHAHMGRAMQTGYPRLWQIPIRDDRVLTIACYGPSLEQTYQTMQRPILSMSGATRWLAEHGVMADYHVDMDPREHKIKFIDPPVPGVHYLMSTVCHPKTWELLQGQRVTLWHVYSSPETYDVVSVLDHGALVIRGGSTIGLTALHVGGVMGYRHFEIHGMDGSGAPLADGAAHNDARSWRHAGPHYGTKQTDGITWDSEGITYQTSRIMANAVTETLNSIASYPIFTVFHGQGLTQALVRERNLPNACTVEQTEKVAMIRKMTAHILDPAPVWDGAARDIWDRLCAETTPEMLADLQAIRAVSESRRRKAKYDTGSILFDQMVQLRTLTLKQRPKTIVEIGTFIGNSTLAMTADHIYTCDKSNNCFQPTKKITCFPFTGSTSMLTNLVEKKVRADLFFFDGRIQVADLPLIQRLSHPGTLYVFDDYLDNQKGIINAKMLSAVIGDGWVLLEPDDRLAGKSTLAALVPKELLS
jgi:predicted O-methyltransferase YrrM